MAGGREEKSTASDNSALRDYYKVYRASGMSRERARRQAFLDKNRADETRRIDTGLDYDDVTVRVSTVHAREDIALLAWELGEIRRRLPSPALTNLLLLAILLVLLFR